MQEQSVTRVPRLHTRSWIGRQRTAILPHAARGLPLARSQTAEASLNLTLEDGVANAAREQSSVLKQLYEQRLRDVVGQLRETMSKVRGDSSVQVLLADSSTASFAASRMEEILDGALQSEREATIVRLSEALSAREVELRSLQRCVFSCSATCTFASGGSRSIHGEAASG